MVERTLTWREREVECLALRPMTDNAIAAYLGISRSTASRHIESILEKRSVSSRYELQRTIPKSGDFVVYVGSHTQHRDRTWEIYDFEDDADGYRCAVLIDPDYDARSGEPDPTVYVRDLNDLFVIDRE